MILHRNLLRSFLLDCLDFIIEQVELARSSASKAERIAVHLARGRISEFESSHPCQTVWSLRAVSRRRVWFSDEARGRLSRSRPVSPVSDVLRKLQSGPWDQR